jgi:hypothetical protein
MSTHEHFSEKDLERLLHIFATNAEAQLPDSDEEIAAFFRSLDVSNVPTPNVEKFKSFLSRELHPKTKLMSAAEIFKDLLGKQQSKLSAEGSLVAARKGKRIKAKTRAQIDKAKKKRPE